MKIIDRIWKDIRKGENLDLYITIVLAIVIGVLNLVNVVPSLYLQPIMLIIMGFLASIAETRSRIQNMVKIGESSKK